MTEMVYSHLTFLPISHAGLDDETFSVPPACLLPDTTIDFRSINNPLLNVMGEIASD